MTVLATEYGTLLEHAKMFGPDGNVSDYIEALAQDNEIVQDLPFVECNKMSSHQHTVEVALPDIYWKLLGAGVLASDGAFAQIEDATGMMESWSNVEKALADLGGNPARVRLNRAKQHLSAQGIEFASTFFYGAASSPEEFIGMAPRYSSLSAVNAENIIDAGGTGSDNASIWLMGFGEMKLHGIFAKGTKAGINREDFGAVVVDNWQGTTGAQAVVYKEKFGGCLGVALADWRYAVRICNIDVSNLVSETSAADLIKLMIKAKHRIPGGGAGSKLKFYMNRTCQEFLDIQGRDAVISGGGIKYENVGGQPIMSLRGVPIGRCDALLETEARVT